MTTHLLLLLSLSPLILLSGAGSAEPVAEAPDPTPIEVVRITRDFGKPHFDLALDAFSSAGEVALRDVRLQWVNTSARDRRKPLGPITDRMVKVNLRRDNDRSATVTITGDSKEFAFALELRDDSVIDVYVAALADGGQAIPRCHVTRAHLIARRILGVAAGLDHIAVECADIDGHLRPARIQHREL